MAGTMSAAISEANGVAHELHTDYAEWLNQLATVDFDMVVQLVLHRAPKGDPERVRLQTEFNTWRAARAQGSTMPASACVSPSASSNI